MLPIDAELSLENQMPYVGSVVTKTENFLLRQIGRVCRFPGPWCVNRRVYRLSVTKGELKSATCVDVGRGQLHHTS